MMPCHAYQREKAELLGNHILNVACKEDPARLGKDLGAINCDVNDFDPQENLSLYEVPNFQVGDACDLPFGDKSFDVVVLGEFLEHCPYNAANLALYEAKRVLTSGGRIILTIPLDGRPKEVQHAPEHLVTWKHGITSWHQTVWEDALLAELLEEVGLEELPEHREEFEYGFCRGIGCVLRRKA
jgi:SAM-dependent methyltransferase